MSDQAKLATRARQKGYQKYPTPLVVEAIVASRGILASAARALGCSRTTLRKYVREIPEVAAAAAEENASFLDVVESRLMDVIDDPDHPSHFSAIRFALRTKGRMRGYGDRLEVAAEVDATIIIKVGGE